MNKIAVWVEQGLTWLGMSGSIMSIVSHIIMVLVAIIHLLAVVSCN